MVHVYRITAGLLLYLLLIYSCRRDHSTTAAAEAANSAPQPASFAELFPLEGTTPAEKEAYRARTAERVEQLAKMEENKSRRDSALEEHPAHVAGMIQQVQPGWQNLIRTNFDHFTELKARAAADPAHQTACDICDGHSYMPCLLCGGIKSCLGCAGEGERGNELCPTCMGSGKCSLCSGFGKMLCPFCDDGVIYQDHKDPRARSWLEP